MNSTNCNGFLGRRGGFLEFLLLIIGSLSLSASGFAAPRRSRPRPRQQTSCFVSTEPQNEILSTQQEQSGSAGTFLDFTLFPHKPLGCMADESLAKSEDNRKHVFVSKITAGGNAEKAGLQVGDVIVGVTGIFGDLEDTTGLGLDKVKGLVSSRPDDEPLRLRVVRGTTVMEDHERALVELCSDPNLDGKEAEDCIVAFLKDSYNMDVQDSNGFTDTESEENLVADMYSMWAEDFDGVVPAYESTSMKKDQSPSKASVVKPWSSRASPSGTWVRDPKTGAMRNIDG